MPRRVAITVVMGEPLEVPHVAQPTPAQVRSCGTSTAAGWGSGAASAALVSTAYCNGEMRVSCINDQLHQLACGFDCGSRRTLRCIA